MASGAGLCATGLLEKDRRGDYMWLWIYPLISSKVKENIQRSCDVIWDNLDENNSSLCVHFSDLWIYVRIQTSDSLGKFCLSVISSEFNPPLYLTLAEIFLERYTTTSTPVSILETYLEVFTQGRCTADEKRTFNVKNFDVVRYALTEAKVKDVVSLFAVETILIFTAMLLKKRIVIHHPNCLQLANICRSVMLFTYHRSLNWNALFPLVHLAESEVEELRLVTGGYVAGFTDSAVETRSDLYDLFVNAHSKEITVAPHAREAFAMGKLHKDLATFIMQCVEDDGKSDQQCVLDIANRTKDLLTNLKSFCVADAAGKQCVSAETLREKRLPPATENFLLNLASVEGLLLI